MEPTSTNQPTKTRQELRADAERMLKEGTSQEDVHQYLLSQGLDVNSSYAILGSLTGGRTYYQNEDLKSAAREGYNYHSDRSDNSGATTDIAIGGLFLVGGIVFTVMSYSNAGPGGTYVVTWGAMVFGAIRLFRGLSNQ